MFANCVCFGIWNNENSTVQGDEHPKADRFFAVLGNLHLQRYNTQKQDLLKQLARRFQEKGVDDSDIGQRARQN